MIKTAKIIEVINEWHMRQKRDARGNTIWQTDDTEKLANALIVAGIGDVWSITAQAEKVIQAAARRVRALEDEYSAMREAMKDPSEQLQEYIDLLDSGVESISSSYDYRPKIGRRKAKSYFKSIQKYR